MGIDDTARSKGIKLQMYNATTFVHQLAEVGAPRDFYTFLRLLFYTQMSTHNCNLMETDKNSTSSVQQMMSQV